MAKKKLKRFADYKEFKNCFDFPYELKGKWSSDYFKNDKPIVLELACGKGEYTLALAHRFPERNFIGIDIKASRMWVGAKTALEENMENVAFVRLLIQKLPEIFANNEVSEIWITFPDPYPKDKHEKNRLTCPKFLSFYKEILKPGSVINFKTDNDFLFSYTLDVLGNLKIKPKEVIFDVHSQSLSNPNLQEITTFYEKKFIAIGKSINYCKFSLDELVLI